MLSRGTSHPTYIRVSWKSCRQIYATVGWVLRSGCPFRACVSFVDCTRITKRKRRHFVANARIHLCPKTQCCQVFPDHNVTLKLPVFKKSGLQESPPTLEYPRNRAQAFCCPRNLCSLWRVDCCLLSRRRRRHHPQLNTTLLVFFEWPENK